MIGCFVFCGMSEFFNLPPTRRIPCSSRKGLSWMILLFDFKAFSCFETVDFVKEFSLLNTLDES